MDLLISLAENAFWSRGIRTIVAESRGPREDALLQYEYVRPLLDGTSYISPTWFRQRLSASITFMTKKDYCSGLELADLLARPCAEKIINPTTNPVRWSEFKLKLCDGKETAHSILGLKTMPWRKCYDGIWKS